MSLIAVHSTTETAHYRLAGRSIGIGLALVLALVALDQVLKYLMVLWLGPDATVHRWELAGRYLAFDYVENEGAAFGILAGRTALLTVLAIVVAVGFVALVRRDLARNRTLQIASVLILAGAIGNLIDRVRLGYVVDFVAIGIWPKFNVADACISIALILLAWTFFQPQAESGQPFPESKEPELE